MSTALPTRPRLISQRRTFAIVASQYNPTLVQGLVDHTAKELSELAPSSQIILRQVPGAFEIPVVVQELAQDSRINAIIALGVIIQGETQHAELVAQAVTNALMELSLKYRMPVIHEVLLLKNEEQGRKRCLDPEINRGIEAARAAVQIVQVLSELKAKA